MNTEVALLSLASAGLGSIGGVLATLVTFRRDRNLNHGSIVNEYRDLLRANKDELERITGRVAILELSLIAAYKRVKELEEQCGICKYRIQSET